MDEGENMDEIVGLQRQIEQLEAVLNVTDALRPDLPPAELYDLALQAICGLGNYTVGSLWLYSGKGYRCGAWYGFDRQRAALVSNATLDDQQFQHLLALSISRASLHWMTWPLDPTIPEPLRASGAVGHTAIMPLTFIDQVGFVALESGSAQPDDASIPLLARLADRVAVALDAAHVFQARSQTIDELHHLMAEQRVLQATVLELSAPLLPLLPGVLVLPLIGSIDGIRAERILETELNAIIREQAKVVLVDITGTAVVDTNVAMQLVRSASAALLLGCRTILVGVRPEVAQTLVGLGIDLQGIATRSTLADGLQAALRIVHYELTAL